MKRLVAALALGLVATVLPLASESTTPASQPLPVALVRTPTAAQAGYVAQYFDETHRRVPGFVEVVLWPGDAARLRADGFEFAITTPDLRTDAAAQPTKAAAPVALPGPDRDDYRALGDYEKEMRDLAEAHPGLVRLLTLRNKSLEGRSVYGVEIAAGVGKVDGRPTYLVDGVHHAREWPSGEFPMIFAHSLVEDYVKNDKATRSLLSKLRVIIVPVVNVDGFVFSRDFPVDVDTIAVGLGSYWRKNKRSVSGQTVGGVNPDAYGVDPNRNYAFMWGDDQGGSSDAAFAENNRGAGPLSEPEAQNIADLLLTRPIAGLITNHTFGNLVMHPWGWTDADTADEALFVSVGERLADTLGDYQNIKAIELYITSGGSRDWAYGAVGTLPYTFEHGNEFHPAYGAGVGERQGDVLRAFRIMADVAADARHHAVVAGRVVDRAGRPVRATLTLRKTVSVPLWPGNPSSNDAMTHQLRWKSAADAKGLFAWHVPPSVRPQIGAAGARESFLLDVAAGGKVRTIKVTVRRGQRLDLGTIRLP